MGNVAGNVLLQADNVMERTMLMSNIRKGHALSQLAEGPSSGEGGDVDEGGWDEGGWDKDGWGDDG